MPTDPSSAPDTPPTPRPYARRTAWLVLGLGLLIGGAWLLGTPPGILGKADAIGYAICHRIPTRSFHVHDRALPLCARCTGIYLGVMLGALVYAFSGRLRASRLPPLRVLAVLGLFGAAIALDGINSYLSLFDFYRPPYAPTNTLRLITGLYAGLTMITVVVPVFNMSAWRDAIPYATLRTLRELAALCALGAGVIVATLADVAALRVAAGLVSVAGVVLMFTLIGGVLFLTATRRDGSLTAWRELRLPGAAGLVFAIMLIAIINAARYALTGTWDGFTFLQ